MCDSDSETDDLPHIMGIRRPWDKHEHLSCPKKKNSICEYWSLISPTVKKETCQVMNICIFWPILFKPCVNSYKTQWAIETGFINANLKTELNLKSLHKIEVLETILQALAKGVVSEVLVKRLKRIGDHFLQNFDCVDEAIDWMERAGEPGISGILSRLGSKRTQRETLRFMCCEYVHYMELTVNGVNLVIEFESPAYEWVVKKSEEMKKKGNDQYQKRKYDSAIKWYTKAIKYHPENHILYGNRAICFIRCDKKQKALGDGKRATILKPNWPKGHYRFCEALFLLDEHQRALEANAKAQDLCRDNPDGIWDLCQQNERFRTEIEKLQAAEKTKKKGLKGDSSKKLEAAARVETEALHDTKETDNKPENSNNISETKENEDTDETGDIAGKTEDSIAEGCSKFVKETIRDMPGIQSQNMGQKTPEKKKAKNRTQKPVEKTSAGSGHGDVNSLILDSDKALEERNFRKAEQAFVKALDLLDLTSLKKLNLYTMDYASALWEVGQPEDLAAAKNHFNKVKNNFPKDGLLQSLANYGLGKVYLKENRFSEALDQFKKSLALANLQTTPAILTCPPAKHIMDDRIEHLKRLVEVCIELCTFPPKPDAVCRYQQCQVNSKIQIFFTDLDFKGFIRVQCCQRCCVEYHISCWKKIKAAVFNDKNDKDFLREACFTPDCSGKISKIIIYGSTGLLKCELETNIQKVNATPKLTVKQKCTSIKKLKSKEDRKLRRKQRRKEAMEAITLKLSHESKTGSDCSKADSLDKAVQQTWMIYGDRILQQIIENKELLKEGVQDISNMKKYLEPWTAGDKEKNTFSINNAEQPVAMGDLVELLGQRKNRVLTRVFIEALSKCEDISPKLQDWTQRLNNAGLKAAEAFITRYSDNLEEHDLSPLLDFYPFMEFLTEKFGTKPVFLNSGTCALVDYIKQAPQQEMRLFIWSLENNVEMFPSLKHILNEYFEVMDASCTVLKKQDNEDMSNKGIQGKNRNRKKKLKESKSVYILSGTVGGTHREEDEDDIFTEEDTLRFLCSQDRFMVPEHLRDQVTEFEVQYNQAPRSSHYRRILDNNPDPSRESLYDYFSQILEEHGPMEIDNQLLVGEFENFPGETKEMVANAGGLKSFLLESLRFVMINDLIGLMKHAVSLKEQAVDAPWAASDYINSGNKLSDSVPGNDWEHYNQQKAQLNPSAQEFKPFSINHNDFLSYTPNNMLLTQTPLPSDYGFSSTDSFSALKMALPETDPFGLIHFSPLETAFASVTHSELSDALDCTMSHNSNIVIDNSGKSSIGTSNRVYDPERTDSLKTSAQYTPFYFGTAKDTTSEPFMGSCIYDKVGPESENSKKKKKKKDSKPVFMKAIGVQVYHETTEQEVNTDPFNPFETQQGDIIRNEKELRVLREQLKEVEEKYEQHDDKEINALEREVKEINQKIEITKTELNLIRQKLESDMKKAQQEKREHQESFKTLKNKIKSLNETSEMSLRNIEEKKQEYEKHFNKFLELSNQSAAEKMKLEELLAQKEESIKKAVERARAAEVTLLENQRSGSLYLLYKVASKGEVTAKNLKQLAAGTSSPTLFLPAIDAWQALLSDMQKKIRTAESQYEERIDMVKKGSKLSSLAPVCVPKPPPIPSLPMPFYPFPAPHVLASTVPFHPHFPVPPPTFFTSQQGSAPAMQPVNYTPGRPQTQDQLDSSQLHSGSNSTPRPGDRVVMSNRPFINDPAVLHVSSLVRHQHTGNMQQGEQKRASRASPRASPSPRGSPSPVPSEVTVGKPRQERTPVNQTSAVPDKSSRPAPQQQQNSFEKLIDRLIAMFPHYTRSTLTVFIKDIRTGNGGSLNTLSYEEIINRVAQRILDHQDNTREQIQHDNVSRTTPTKPPSKSTSPAPKRDSNTPPPAHAWRLVASQSKSQWQKNKALYAEDPCIICHEEMSPEDLCVLECRHSFHGECIKAWLKEQSTCPTCRVHALLPEDFPVLPGRRRLVNPSASSSS